MAPAMPARSKRGPSGHRAPPAASLPGGGVWGRSGGLQQLAAQRSPKSVCERQQVRMPLFFTLLFCNAAFWALVFYFDTLRRSYRITTRKAT